MIKIKRDNLPGLVEAVKFLTQTRVYIGVPAREALRKPEPGETKPVNNAMLAYIHENGSETAHIPPRPFLKPTVHENQKMITNSLAAIARTALKGDKTKSELGLHALGLRLSTAVQLKIDTGPFKELSDYTKARRAARGRTGEMKPLVDTGQLRNAIAYTVRERNAVS